MKRVILESPFAPRNGRTIDDNTHYARWCLRDSLNRGEAPIASHLLYPQVLDEHLPSERKLGIDAGLAWLSAADYAVYYTDHGWSPGMITALETALQIKRDIRIRALFNAPQLPLPLSLPASIDMAMLRSKIEQ